MATRLLLGQVGVVVVDEEVRGHSRLRDLAESQLCVVRATSLLHYRPIILPLAGIRLVSFPKKLSSIRRAA